MGIVNTRFGLGSLMHCVMCTVGYEAVGRGWSGPYLAGIPDPVGRGQRAVSAIALGGNVLNVRVVTTGQESPFCEGSVVGLKGR
jgi:hypothetical protein